MAKIPVNCMYCKAEIRGNVQPSPGGVVCGLCVQKLCAGAKLRQKYTKEELIEARKAKGWNRQRLAIHLGVGQSFIAHIESGKKPMSPGVIEWISKSKKSGHKNGVENKQVTP